MAKFRELCNNKGPTITIAVGYNPISWGLKKDYFIDTKESFVFALKKDSLEESALKKTQKAKAKTTIILHLCIVCLC